MPFPIYYQYPFFLILSKFYFNFSPFYIVFYLFYVNLYIYISESAKLKSNLIPFYRLIVYFKELDEAKEILVNPKINNELEGPDGIYSLISSEFKKEIHPKYLMKIKFANLWYDIYDNNIYNFCVSGNLSYGDAILVKIIKK